jgi:putative SOS response-associated peptidase YedK
MCGRYNRKTPLKQIAKLFDCPPPPVDEPARYNIAPTQPVVAVRLDTAGSRQSPALRRGDRATGLVRDGEVIITSWSDARISWPRCRATC